MSSTPSAASQVVADFYNDLNNRDFKSAFDRLTPALQDERWTDGLSAFAAGYTYTLNIGNMSCIEVPPVENTQNHTKTFLVSYDDTITELHYPAMDKLQKATFAQVDNVAAWVEDFNAVLIDKLDAKPDAVQNIPLALYFKQNNVENCMSLSGADYNKAVGLFSQTVETIDQTRFIDVVRGVDGINRINSIRHDL